MQEFGARHPTAVKSVFIQGGKSEKAELSRAGRWLGFWRRWARWFYLKKLEWEFRDSQTFEQWLKRIRCFHLADAEAENRARIHRQIASLRNGMASNERKTKTNNKKL
jgi:hypothetical protein